MSWQAYRTSNPPTQNVTAAVRIRMRGSSEPRTAIHAAAGATPREKPSSRCDQRVKRLVNEYRVTRASATGERYRVRRFNWAAARTKTAQHTTTNSVTNLSERIPAGMARVA